MNVNQELEKPFILPPGWRWAKLRNAISEALPGFAIGERDADGVIQLRMNNVDTRGRLTWDQYIRVPATEETKAKYHLVPGDVVFNNTNSTALVGKSAIFTENSETIVYSNHFTRLRTKGEQLYSPYLAYWLIYQWQNRIFENLCDRWIGQSAVKNDKLLKLEIPLPPLSEQKRIAGILNERIAAIDKARAGAEAQLEAAKALPAAYRSQVFPKEGQQLPSGWRWVILGSICDVVNGFGFPENLQGRTDLSYPFVKVSDMNAPGAEVVVSSAVNTVDRDILDCLGARIYPSRTIIFPKVGGALFTNKKRILGKDSCFDNNVMGLVPRDVDADFLFCWFQTVDLRTLCNVQALPSIKQSRIASLRFPMPTYTEQKRIAAVLNKQMASAEQLRADLEKQLHEINALPAALLRRAFRGEL